MLTAHQYFSFCDVLSLTTFLNSLQVGILGTIDLSHAALSNFLQNLVMANARADHATPPHAMQLRPMLRGEGVKGNQYEQQVSVTVGALLVKNADEPASTGLPASPRPV